MNHYVYKITNLINGKKYIGKRSCRCPIEEDKYMGSGTLLKKAKLKYGIENFKKEILIVCDTEKYAFEKEMEYIKKYNAFEDSNYYNLTEGGEGATGWIKKLTPNQLDDLRERLKKNSWYIANRRNIIEGEIKAPRNNTYKEVVQLTLKGEQLAIYASPGVAAKILGFNSSSISGCCSPRTENKTYKGYIFMYLDDYINMQNSIDNYEDIIDCNNLIFIHDENEKSKTRSRQKVKVLCVNTNEVFDSIKGASKYHNINPTSISEACRYFNKHKKYKRAGEINGYPAKWIYYDDYLDQVNEKENII